MDGIIADCGCSIRQQSAGQCIVTLRLSEVLMAVNPRRKSRVLAIDDEPSMTEWLKILLEHAGYDVRTALIGTRGEELFRSWRPDAVVTDMLLPDVDGIELVRTFKQLDPEAEVIV